METIHVVQPFVRIRSGLMPKLPMQFGSIAAAARRAEMIAHEFAGVIAYSMDIDEAGGDYSQPVVHFQAGDVPELDE